MKSDLFRDVGPLLTILGQLINCSLSFDTGHAVSGQKCREEYTKTTAGWYSSVLGLYAKVTKNAENIQKQLCPKINHFGYIKVTNFQNCAITKFSV